MSVRITKDGFRRIKWDNESQQHIEEEVQAGKSFISQLREATTIDPDVTLSDIFRAVESDTKLKEFLGPYSWCDMDAYHQEIKRPTSGKCDDLKCIEITSYFEARLGDEGQIVLGIQGVGHDSTVWGIDFTPINELANTLVRLNSSLDYYVEGESKDMGYHYCYSLLDILDTIYFEISFHGKPKDRDAVAESLKEMSRQVESGEVELTPLEDIREMLGRDKPN